MAVKNSLLPQENENNPSLAKLLENDKYKSRFEQVLGKRAPQFMSSILSAVNANNTLKDASPQTVIQAAMKAAVLDLPIDGNLGFAYIVPYKNKGVSEASFQMGYKGFIQLALRTGQYKSINVIEVRETELKSFNRLSEEIELDFVDDDDERNKLPVIGYAGFFKLVNGFEKTVYWTVKQVEKHANEYSQTYRRGYGNWKDNFDAMAKKTVVKLMLSKWGILSIDMQKALEADQAVIDDNGQPTYPDNEPIIEANFKEEQPAAVVVEDDDVF